MEFTILGPTRLHVQGVQVDLGTFKQRGLLALLLHDVNNSVPIDTLVGELWSPDRTFEEVRPSLHAMVSRLRKALEKAGAPARIDRHGEAYRIDTDPALIDLHRFRAIAEQAYEAAAKNDHAKACALLKEALALWTPMPLGDVRGPWADHCREQMESFDRLPAHYALFDSQLALGENNEVLRVVADLVRRHELDEDLVLRQLRALVALGRITDAIRVYNRFRERIADELGTDPGPELRTLHAGLLKSDRDSAMHAQLTVQMRATRQLPRAVPDFVGRVGLLARLDALVENGDAAGSHRVFTLHGMPGVGKTSLAVRWIDRNHERFPDGQLSVDLCGYGPTAPLTPEAALAVLLVSLGFGVGEIPHSPDERQAKVRGVLGTRKTALLLDNARNTAQVRPLLAATPNCVVLITSRDLLSGLLVQDHAVSLTVSPLDAEESLALLTASLGPVRAAEDRNAVQRLASLTSGLPLGLRIVTQRVVERPHTRLADLAHELQRQDVLGALGADDDEAATLAAPFSWSFQALSPSAACTFVALGLLPGPDFSAEAVCALLDAERSEVDQNLRALVRVNLLQSGMGRRYRLHDMLHGYAAQLAGHTDVVLDPSAAQRRLVDWYVLSLAAGYRRLVPVGVEIPPLVDPSPVRPMVFADESEVISWVTDEVGNVAEVAELSWRLGLLSHTWRLAANAQEIYDRLSLHREISALLRTGLAAAKALDDREAICGLTNDYGMAAYRLRDNVTARSALTEALEIAEADGFHELRAIVLANLASAVLALGDASTAVSRLREALILVREFGSPYTEANTVDQLANAYRELGRDDLAVENYFTALSIRKRIGHIRGMGTTLSELAVLYHEHGENSEALDFARRAVDMHTRSGDREHVGVTLVTMAAVLYDFGSFDESIRAAVQALEMAEWELGEKHRVRALLLLGYAHAACGGNEEARAAWSRAVEILVAAGTPADDKRLVQLGGLLRTDVRIAQHPNGVARLGDVDNGK